MKNGPKNAPPMLLPGAKTEENPVWEALPAGSTPLSVPMREPNWALVLPAGAPTVPGAEYRDLAASYWLEICKDLDDMGTLAPANGHAIKRLVIARIRYDFYSQELSLQGEIIAARRTGTAMRSVYSSVAADAAAECLILERELGVSPRGRANVARTKMKKTIGSRAAQYTNPEGAKKGAGK